jgi:cytochrome c2
MPWLRTRIAWAVVVLAIVVIAACLYANRVFAQNDLRHRAEVLTGGNAARGQMLFVAKGCGGCHSIDHVRQANGLVGPPLTGIAERAIIAGVLENNPANLERWISTPQSVVPGNAMPDIPMTPGETRDIAAFLYTRI